MTKTEFFEAFAKHEYAVRVASQEEHDDFVNASPWKRSAGYSDEYPVLMKLMSEDIIVGCADFNFLGALRIRGLISYQEYISLTSEPIQETICLDVDLVL